MRHRILPSLVMCATLLGAAHALALTGGKSPLHFDVDVARFYYDSQSVYIQFYYSVSEGALTYRRDSAAFVGGANMTLQLRNDTGVAVRREWGIPHMVHDTAEFQSGQKLVGIESFVVPPGSYSLKFSGYDLLDTNRRDSIAEPLSVAAFPQERVASSDIELCTSIRPSADKKSMYYKNTFEVVPNPSGMYGKGLPMLYYYTEAYNLRSDTSLRYIVIRTTVTDAVNREVIRHDKTKPRTVNSSVEAGTVNIADVRGGTYELHVAFMDSGGKVFASSSKKFFVYKPGSARDSAVALAAGDVLASEYAVKTEAELDKEFDQAKYIASSVELDQYKKLSGLVGKRSFLFEFWRRREKLKEGYKVEYMKRVEYAAATYKNGMFEGWKTDRGRVAILYGPPDEIERFQSSSESNPYEIWHYNGLEGGVIFVFVDRSGFGQYIQVHSTYRSEIQDEDWYTHYAQKMQ